MFWCVRIDGRTKVYGSPETLTAFLLKSGTSRLSDPGQLAWTVKEFGS